jgi:cytochrome c-type biogenesis protein CcmH
MDSHPSRGRLFSAAVIILALLALLMAPSAYAVNPDEVLDDPALEQRARNLSAKLRCLVCQNQSIDDSDAELAKDLRVLLRKRLVAGDSDNQVIDYIVSRYGEFVLLQPRFGLHTLILWSLPAFLILLGFVIILRKTRNRKKADPGILTADENKRIAKLLENSD